MDFDLNHGKIKRVKHYTSRFYKVIAGILLGAPLLHLGFAAILFDVPLHSCVTILLSPFYYVVTFVSVAAGYGLWETQRWSWYVFIVAQVLITYENAIIVSSYAESHHKVFAFVISLLIQALFAVRVGQEIRVPYFFPKIRWWESNPRLKLSVPTKLRREDLSEVSGSILDISLMGCFVKTREDLKIDEKVTVVSSLYGQDFAIVGSVVWCTQTAVTHPRGVGVKFDFLSKTQRRSLRLITHQLKRISSLYRRSRYLMSQEDFLKELDRLESVHLHNEH